MTTPYAEWPAKVQEAFEVYYGEAERSLEKTTLAMKGKPSLRTLKRWSAEHGWQLEVDRRKQAEAREAEAAAIIQRNKLRTNVETGLSKIAQDFAFEASGICSMCQGKRRIISDYGPDGQPKDTEDCPKCGGTGRTYPLEVMRKYGGSFQRMFATLGTVWATGPEKPADEAQGTSEEEFQRLQNDMLRRAGVDLFEDD